ncbi:MAG: hypothetical protein LWY06_00975 [Firmicutes bacterium]|nr:hypothetical protein [Bacillota bacterium]
MKLIRQFIIILAIFIFSFSFGWAEQAKGILYFIEGGTGAGICHVYTGRQLLKLHYTKYKEYGFEHQEGYKYGSIWNVKYHTEAGGRKVIDSIEFTGKYDPAVKAADEMVRSYYIKAARGEFTEAYKMLSPGWQKDQSFDSYNRGMKKIKFKESAESAPTFALKIIGHNSGEVLLLVNTFWFYEGASGYLKMEVKKVNGVWTIDRVTPVSFKQWDES